MENSLHVLCTDILYSSLTLYLQQYLCIFYEVIKMNKKIPHDFYWSSLRLFVDWYLNALSIKVAMSRNSTKVVHIVLE